MGEEEEEVWVRVKDLIFVLFDRISLVGERRSEEGEKASEERGVTKVHESELRMSVCKVIKLEL